MTTAKDTTPKKKTGHRFQKGNKLSRLGDHSPNLHKDFITQQLRAALHDKPKKANGEPNPKEKEYYAKMVDKLIAMACEGNEWAINFIWERIEGKVPNVAVADVNHNHRSTIVDALPLLTDKELAVMERAARKVITGIDYKEIEGKAN